MEIIVLILLFGLAAVSIRDNFLKTKERERAAKIADIYQRLCAIAAEQNQGWDPDWNFPNMGWNYPVKKHMVFFTTREAAETFVDRNKELLQEYMNL